MSFVPRQVCHSHGGSFLLWLLSYLTSKVFFWIRKLNFRVSYWKFYPQNIATLMRAQLGNREGLSSPFALRRISRFPPLPWT
jgi:hypothetical protein